MRTRRGRRSTRRTAEEAQQDDDDAQPDASGSGASGSRNVYSRCLVSLPQHPILHDMRPLIRPDGQRHITLDVLAACSYYVFKFIM
jgi:hypothetical protein